MNDKYLDKQESLKCELDKYEKIEEKKETEKSVVSNQESNQLREDITETYSSKEEYIQKIHSQDIAVRSKILNAIENDINTKIKVREQTFTTIIWYLIIVTVITLLLIGLGGKFLNISDNIEIALVGTVLGSIISIVILFCKYAFSDSTKLIDLFLKLSKDKKESTNKK